MNLFRRIAALSLVLLLAGQVVVRPLHRHDHDGTASAEASQPASFCQFCHHAHSPSVQPQHPAAPSRGDSSPEDDSCTICRFLSLSTLPTVAVELPLAYALEQEAVLVEPLTRGRATIGLLRVRGPPA